MTACFHRRMFYGHKHLCLMKPQTCVLLAAGLLAGALVTVLLSGHLRLLDCSVRLQSADTREGRELLPPIAGDRPANQSTDAFQRQYNQLVHKMNDSLYRFDRPGLLLPLMRLAEAERSRAHRVAAGRTWLRSQSLVVAATVRSGMAGLPSSMRNVQRLRALFKESWLVIVENDSTDSTRSFLLNLTRTDPNVRLLGCGCVNSPLPCKVNIRYSSGRLHVPGIPISRSVTEEVERGLVMSALRNLYLDYIYSHLADRASLLMVIDPDVSWGDWDLDNIAQGAYYFAAKPRLQQLCAHSCSNAEGTVYDPCTLSFHLNKRFGEDTKYPAVSYDKSIRDAPDSLPPVKVESCFQALAFYRLADLAARRLLYERSPGEWMCEHNTLSRQLGEVYIDPQMRLRVTAGNVG